jgi:DNA-binding transcriptional ArsR family regulator
VDAALKALAEPRRREILRLVWHREMLAGDIAQHFEVTRSAISQHLGVLRDAALVTERRDGTRRWYRARPDTVEDLRDFLGRYWTTGLQGLREVAGAAEAADRGKRTSSTRGRNG